MERFSISQTLCDQLASHRLSFADKMMLLDNVNILLRRAALQKVEHCAVERTARHSQEETTPGGLLNAGRE